jgi:FkbM family methyltransferase
MATVEQAKGPVCDVCLPMVAIVGATEARSYCKTLLEQGTLKSLRASCSICGAVGSAYLAADKPEPAALPGAPSPQPGLGLTPDLYSALVTRLSHIENQLAQVTACLRVPERHRPPVYLGDGTVMCWVSPGFKFFVDANDQTMTPHFLYDGGFEANITALFSKLVHPGDTVLDVGANYGYYTMLAAIGVGPQGRVYAIEASPANFAFLKRNVFVNGLGSFVKIFEKAALNERKLLELFFEKGYAGGPSLFTFRLDNPRCQRVAVEAVPIDDLIPEDKVDVIKIDVEGSEPLVLEGMTKLLARSPKVKILMEFGPPMIRNAKVDPAQFLRRIHELGFATWRINLKSELERFDEAKMCQSGDIEMLLLARPGTVIPGVVLP